MISARAGGILLHPTSLPGPFGCGDIGRAARGWIDWLHAAGISLWQMLPLGPTGYGDSPYQCLSAFAGNPLLISFDGLIQEGWLERNELKPIPEWETQVDYGELILWKFTLLERAADRFLTDAIAREGQDFQQFCLAEASWLDDYAMFVTIKDLQQGEPWTSWPDAYSRREAAALEGLQEEYAPQIRRVKALQYIFFQQWARLRHAAHQKRISLIGDMPIFVAHDSADVWARPDLFLLGNDGLPEVVAGVPPDYFSATGQRWGNPLYDWDRMREGKYAWWKSRLGATLKLVDVVRLDHFRGFEAYWEIPGESDTAVEGKWVPGPGTDLLDALQGEGDLLPILAEDLGIITPAVDRLRERYGLPGMKVLQFGLEGGASSPDLPHLYPENCAAYTGTHDNNTSRGWFSQSSSEVQSFTRAYLACADEGIVWAMLRAIWGSRAGWSIAPMQDFLGLGEEARMNYPGTSTGNWRWRMDPGALSLKLANEVRALNEAHGRLPG